MQNAGRGQPQDKARQALRMRSFAVSRVVSPWVCSPSRWGTNQGLEIGTLTISFRWLWLWPAIQPVCFANDTPRIALEQLNISGEPSSVMAHTHIAACSRRCPFLFPFLTACFNKRFTCRRHPCARFDPCCFIRRWNVCTNTTRNAPGRARYAQPLHATGAVVQLLG
jgi:hypothetical protein